MHAINAAIGERYLSKKGVPVTVVGHKGEKVVLKIKGSDNDIEVAKDYELKPYKESEVSKEAKVLAQSSGKAKKSGLKPTTLASIIDPLLFSGTKTVKEIADAVIKQAADLVEGRDTEANVRARMVSFSRKGWKIEKNEKKQVRVIKPKEASHAN